MAAEPHPTVMGDWETHRRSRRNRWVAFGLGDTRRGRPPALQPLDGPLRQPGRHAGRGAPPGPQRLRLVPRPGGPGVGGRPGRQHHDQVSLRGRPYPGGGCFATTQQTEPGTQLAPTINRQEACVQPRGVLCATHFHPLGFWGGWRHTTLPGDETGSLEMGILPGVGPSGTQSISPSGFSCRRGPTSWGGVQPATPSRAATPPPEFF